MHKRGRQSGPCYVQPSRLDVACDVARKRGSSCSGGRGSSAWRPRARTPRARTDPRRRSALRSGARSARTDEHRSAILGDRRGSQARRSRAPGRNVPAVRTCPSQSWAGPCANAAPFGHVAWHDGQHRFLGAVPPANAAAAGNHVRDRDAPGDGGSRLPNGARPCKGTGGDGSVVERSRAVPRADAAGGGRGPRRSAIRSGAIEGDGALTRPPCSDDEWCSEEDHGTGICEGVGPRDVHAVARGEERARGRAAIGDGGTTTARSVSQRLDCGTRPISQTPAGDRRARRPVVRGGAWLGRGTCRASRHRLGPG